MAKKRARRYKHSIATDGGVGEPPTTKALSRTDEVFLPEKPLSSRVQHMVDEVRADFRDFTNDLGSVMQSRLQVAPKFMKAYRAFAAETPGPEKGKFLAFVRILDPSVPADRDGYRNHSSYQAAGYLRSIEALAGLEPADKPAVLPATPMTALSRVVAMILPTIQDEGAFWAAFKTRLHWSEAQVERLQETVKRQRELMKVTGKLAEAPKLITSKRR